MLTMVPVLTARVNAPIDRSVVGANAVAFAGTPDGRRCEIIEEDIGIRVELSGEYYPGEISARFEIRWYRHQDFNLH